MALDVNEIERFRNNLWAPLRDLLNWIKGNSPSNLTLKLWIKKRSSFLESMESSFQCALGETRRPLNEITLWDQTHFTASLLKSSLAKVIIENTFQAPLDMKLSFQDKYKWRILRVNFDVLSLIRKRQKIGDVLGYKFLIERTLSSIRNKIEVCFPLGNELYCDSTGIYFSFPGVDDNITQVLLQKLKSILSFQRITLVMGGSPTIEAENIGRSITYIGREIDSSRKKIRFPYRSDSVSKRFSRVWQDASEKKEVCPVCRLRSKKEEEEACSFCKERRHRRGKE